MKTGGLNPDREHQMTWKKSVVGLIVLIML